MFSVAVVLTEYTLSLCCKVDIEMDGKMLNSHGVDFLDGPLGLDLDEKDLDEEETRRDMAKILKELKQKHPDKEVCNDVRSDKTCCQRNALSLLSDVLVPWWKIAICEIQIARLQQKHILLCTEIAAS